MTLQGVIVRLVLDRLTGQSRGFGFVKGDDGLDYFLHRSGLEQTTVSWAELREGQRVEFTPIDGAPGKGPRAIETRIL